MMRKPALFSIICSALILASVSGAQTCTVILNFTNLISQPANVKSVRMLPINPGPAWNQALISPFIAPWIVQNTPSLTNGTLTISNAAVNYGFQFTVSAPPYTFVFTNFYQLSDSNSVVQAANRVCVNLNQGAPFVPVFLNPVISNVVINVGGSTSTNGNFWNSSTNVSTSRNAQVIYVFPTPPYTSNNFPYSVTFTN